MLYGTRLTWLSIVTVAFVAVACGEGLEEAPGGVAPESLESRTDAVISGASKGSTIRANGSVNLRSCPGTTYGILLAVPAGHTATVLNPTPTNGFYYMNYQGTVGWSSGTYWDVVAGLVVNGNTLSANQESRVRWIASNTVPRLSGTRDERLTKASRVTWWSLKEGVLDLTNPHAYSNCHFSTGDARIGPLETCPSGNPWQVGIAGVQVPNYTLSSVESTALSLYSGWTLQQVLGNAAVTAGYASGTSTYNSIVNSTGDLRKSWLLRNHAVGFTRNEPTVTSECITNSAGWCYSPNWYPSSAYAPNKDAAMRSIRELKAILDGLAP